MAVQKLTIIQKERIKRLEPALRLAAKKGDFASAKQIVVDLQSIYLPTGNEAKLMQAKNILFEAAMEAGNLTFAEQGFNGVRQKTSNRTRVHLEATALLAICYIRQTQLDKAEPLIREVLINDQVIQSEPRREEFRKLIIERFDEEATLFALKVERQEDLNIDEIQKEAEQLESRSEEQLFESIGRSIPVSVKDILFRIDDFSKKQLPSAERKRLPAPENMLQNQEVGKTLFSSIKRVLYKSLCDPESDIYKAWYNRGLGFVLNKFTLTANLAASTLDAFINLGIGLKGLVVPAIALILKFGIEVYCDRYKPIDIMDLR